MSSSKARISGVAEGVTRDILVRAREDQHHRDKVLQAADMRDITQAALDDPYCIQCHYAAWRDHDWKYIGVGGFLTGPFCSRHCHWAWLAERGRDE